MTEQPSLEQRIAEVLKHKHRFIPVNHRLGLESVAWPESVTV